MRELGKKIKIFFIDDHKIIIDGLIYLFEGIPDIEVLGYALCKKSAETKLRQLSQFPDVIICDYCLPDGTGPEIIRSLKQYNTTFKYIFLTVRNERDVVKFIWDNGCHGYIVKNQSTKEIKQAIYDVMKNKRYISPELVEKLKEKRALPVLTKRESEVANLLTKGFTACEISDQLNISQRTVDNHRMNIYKKLEINSVIQLSIRINAFST